jgi:hypothetical protein
VHRHVPYAPRHRSEHPAPRVVTRLRRVAGLSVAAVAATGLAVSSGIAMQGDAAGEPASAALASGQLRADHRDAATVQNAADVADRTRVVSRSDQRTAVDTTKARALSQESGGQVTQTKDLTNADPRTIARAMLGDFGFGQDQFSCLESLYDRESGWNVHADNPSSSAYGIPQALPGSKMSSAGPNWESDPATQIRWGLGYIKDRYGTPCGAWGHSQSNGWY